MTTDQVSASESRQRIIDASTNLFLEQGFAGTSMSVIAKANQMTKASLYHHFAGKEDLFIACVTHGYSAALDGLQAIVDGSGAPEQKLHNALVLLYDITISSPVGRMSPLIAEVSRTFPKVARSFHSDYVEPQQDLLWTIIEDGTKQRVFKETDRDQLFHILFGPIVTLSLSREMFASFDDLDTQFPIQRLRDSHIKVIVDLLLR